MMMSLKTAVATLLVRIPLLPVPPDENQNLIGSVGCNHHNFETFDLI
jgi:hypothetical protein